MATTLTPDTEHRTPARLHTGQACLLVFDLDGTLIDSERDLGAAVNLTRADFKLPPLPLKIIIGHVGNGGRVLLERCLADAPVDLDDAYARWKTHYREHLTIETTLYPGAAEGLPELAAAGHTLAIATNKPQSASDLIVRHFGLASFFHSVLGGGGPIALKPDPAMLETLMAQTGFAPEQTWMIGDNYTDLECARRAGVRSIFLTYGYGETCGETPTLTLTSFAEITAMFV
ncbi:MAG: HAD-IA family hydrolase [bacterium]